MHNIALIGAGKIGSIIAEFLTHSGDYQVTLIDQNAERLQQVKDHVPGITTQTLDATDEAGLTQAFSNQFAVLNACPFDVGGTIAKAAAASNTHYFDLTEDVQSTRFIRELAQSSDCAFIPQCGLAPGFISIVAHHLAKDFESLHNVHMRVGALPIYPTNALKYNLTWSTDGLINEYLNPCESIVNGQKREVLPLEELEHFSLDGVEYEAFNTSGGLGTLCDTLEGKVENLNYRTVRYPGHRDIMKLLIKDLRLGQRTDVLKDILENSLPITMQDVVLVFVTVSGQKNGHFMQNTWSRKIYARELYGRTHSAIQITTASGICAALDLLAGGDLPQSGFVKQEDIPFERFINNRFGANFVRDTTIPTMDGQKPA